MTTARLKIVGRSDLIMRVDYLRRRGAMIGATCGCFGLLHIGHVRLLREARSRCDQLIVLLNGDDSIRRLKGSGRPIIPSDERAEILASLQDVDYVMIFEDCTPTGMIEAIRPNLWFKGGDYEDRCLPERAAVETYGGEVVILPYVEGRSTTALYGALRGFAEEG